jgi:hypothetical protein
VTEHNNGGAGRSKVFQRGQDGANATVIGDAVTVQRDVEVGADTDYFPGDIPEVVKCSKPHGLE